MGTLRITTTRMQDFQPLAVAGHTAIDAWGALQTVLLRELSSAHAALLSEPVANEARGEIDWYAEANGPAIALHDLPAAEQTALQAALDTISEHIHALIARLAASRASDERFLSELLGLAMQLPGLECVYKLGEQPVLAGWGQRSNNGRHDTTMLTGRAKPLGVVDVLIHAPPASPYAPIPRHGAWRWGALSGALLALLLVLFVLTRDPFGWFVLEAPQCTLDTGQLELARSLQNEVAREGVLRTELASLAASAGQQRLRCPPQLHPASTPLSDDAARAHAQGAQTGRLQIILAWDDRNDLDLQVICPSGMDLNFARRQVCGGILDVDANGDPHQLTASPVESVFFADPQPGRYRVMVDPYTMHERAETPFRVTIRRDGQPDQVVTGVAQTGNRSQPVTEFTVEQP